MKVHGLATVVADDLEDLGALLRAGGDFDQHHFFGNGVAVRVLGAVHHVDELVHLHDDLMQTFGMTADADRHATEAWIACLGDHERLDIKSTTAEHGADATEDAGLIVHVHTERVDVDDVRLWRGLFVGGGGDAIAHGFMNYD